MVRLRLRRGGKKKKPFYWIVAADARCKRDGKFLEKLGFYNPVAQGKAEKLKIEEDRVIDWYMKGAKASDTVYSLMKKTGIVKKIHQIKYNRGGDSPNKDKIDTTEKISE